MEKEILINVAPHEKRIAILEDRKLAELAVERPGQDRIIGNIYKGRVQSVLPGLQCAFIDVGLSRAAFMNISDMKERAFRFNLGETDEEEGEEGEEEETAERRRRIRIEEILRKGQEILVQIVKEPLGTKGARVTNGVSIAGRFLVLVPGTEFIGVSRRTRDRGERRRLKELISSLKKPGIGFIVRTAGSEKSDREFEAEIRRLTDKWEEVVKAAERKKAPSLLHREEDVASAVIRDLFNREVSRIIVDDKKEYQQIVKSMEQVSPELTGRILHYQESQPLFEVFGVEKEIERTLQRKVWLKSGGYLLFDYTEAMVVIDVNTGRSVGKRNVEDNILRTNLEAAREIARQLRLRDLGGLIVIDFIDMTPAENRRKLLDEFHGMLKKDRAPFNIGKVSEFGIVEMTRKRVRENLINTFTEVCTGCGGTGRIFSKASIINSMDRYMSKIRNTLGIHKVLLSVNPSFAAYLMADDKKVFKEVIRAADIRVDLEEDPDLSLDTFKIYDKSKKQEFTSLF